MQLDDVVSSVSPDMARFAEATARSVRWLDRCLKTHNRPNEQVRVTHTHTYTYAHSLAPTALLHHRTSSQSCRVVSIRPRVD